MYSWVRRWVQCLFVMSLSIFFSCASNFSQIKQNTVSETQTPYVWIEIGPHSIPRARAITTEPTCPTLQIDFHSQLMELRSAPDESFPVKVCEAVVPEGTKRVEWNGRLLPLPKASPSRILVVGDTGCRIKTWKGGREIQSCNNPEMWPFLKIIKLAAEWKPDLVIHVGDYIYREAHCPEGNAGCVGSPFGNHWSTWEADFFNPSNELLKMAPWIFVRGNHELCARAGEGWFRFLDPRPFSGQCSDYTDPYFVQVGQKKAVIFDSALAEDSQSPLDQVRKYSSQFKSIHESKNEYQWFFTHRPIWAVLKASGESHLKSARSLNATLQAAIGNYPLSGLELILSGHIHLFEAIRFLDEGPSQLVAGNSGAALTKLPGEIAGVQVGGRTIRDAVTIREFGYMTLEKSADHEWDVIAHDMNGKVLKQCSSQGASVACQSSLSVRK